MKIITDPQFAHVPSAFQFRLGGYKGVLAIDPEADGRTGALFAIGRESDGSVCSTFAEKISFLSQHPRDHVSLSVILC